MSIFATVAFLSDHVWLTDAFSRVTIAMVSAQFVAYATLAVFEVDGVSEVSGGAKRTRFTESVIQTSQAFAGYSVARPGILGIDVSGTLARLARLT
jgi:hypothetical protein